MIPLHAGICNEPYIIHNAGSLRFDGKNLLDWVSRSNELSY